MENRFLTVKEVAEKMGVKQVTTYKWIREGKLKGTYFKIGGVYRFDRLLLDKHLEDMITYD